MGRWRARRDPDREHAHNDIEKFVRAERSNPRYLETAIYIATYERVRAKKLLPSSERLCRTKRCGPGRAVIARRERIVNC